MMDGIDLEKEIERLETSDAWDETDEVVQVEVKRPLDIVVPVRLSNDVWKALRAEAQAVGVGPSTLVRMWVMERLRQKPKAPPQA